MKRILLPLLICPRCLPAEVSLRVESRRESEGDILEGGLHCPVCRSRYAIAEGIAFLNPAQEKRAESKNPYETWDLLSSYLWSHYGDLLGEEYVTDAYSRWAALVEPQEGLFLDAGCAVGRFTFEMAKKFDLVVGIDNSVSFVSASRRLMREGGMVGRLKEEGEIGREIKVELPREWPTAKVEFLVADAQALPFRRHTFAGVSSLNMVDRLPRPLLHLQELNRVARPARAQLLFSDPFSWSANIAAPQEWLGGREQGPFPGWGIENVAALLEGRRAGLGPPWRIAGRGHGWWVIRNHRNHYEVIRSWYLKARR